MTSSISGIGGGFSAASLKQMQEQMFKTADKNGDGKITKDELGQMQGSNPSQNDPSVDEMFTQMDSDNDGVISRLESDAALAKIGQQMQAQGPPPLPPPQGSDSLSADSTSTDATKIFDAMDTNKDGAISPSELAAALAKSDDSASTSSDPRTLLDNLATALQSGNVSDAQTALAALQKDVSAHNGGSSNDPFSKDLQSLSDALQSGSMTGARNIFAGIQDKLAMGPPDKPAGEMAQAQGSSSQDPVATTLQALLDALEKSSSSTSTTADSDTSSTLKDILTAALQSYMQQSSNSYAQSTASSTLLSATA